MQLLAVNSVNPDRKIDVWFGVTNASLGICVIDPYKCMHTFPLISRRVFNQSSIGSARMWAFQIVKILFYELYCVGL